MKAAETKMDQLKGKLGVGRSEKTAEKKRRDTKSDLTDMLDDIGIEAPSMDLGEYIRVLKLARKPTREEFMMIGKVSITGIFLIGMIGFVIYALLTEIPKSI
ncbi:MAG: protein translocase SEC61 complex subunit gamma [Methanothrix sp.]|jgi:protein transport protein SEC61 subunit gamma-like protein|uniref:protein translocase SEC61 complex subunit gamma n=1 Tax=Methanothrix sp. TaxID=90426 RepID=UPI00247E4A0A|nr:protein translocase SEC61 complex subunit gamma [Methanothrix sp.]